MFNRMKAFAASAVVGAVLFGTQAMAAAGDLSGSITTELADGKAEILAVGGAVLVLCAVILLISMVKRSTKG